MSSCPRIAALAVVLLSQAALAADDATIVVTATRLPTRASEVLNDLTVLNRNDIEASGAVSLAELLAGQPGVETVSNGGTGKTASLFLRGAESRHTVVLVDGMRVNSATSGDAAIQHIPLDQIERIEIVRGPVSGLYGSEAIGGVVQVFTRQGDGPFVANIQAGMGNRNSADVAAGFTGRSGGVSYALTAGHFQTDGVSAIANPASFSYQPDDDGYRQDSFSGRIGLEVKPGQQLIVNAFQSDSVSHYDAYGAGSFDARMDQSLRGLGIESRNRINAAWMSTLRFAESRDDLTNYAAAASRSTFGTMQRQLTWQNDVHASWGDILAGIERLEQEVSSTTAYTARDRSVDSLLFGYQGRLAAHRLQLSVRHDHNSQFGGRTTGMAYYGYQLTSALRASVGAGSSFSAPTFNQLYYPGYGNPDLRPEQGRSREASLAWESDHARASLTRFVNRVRDLIQSVEVQPYVYQAENVQKAKLTGWTLVVAGQRAGWRPRLAVDWLEARDEASGLMLPRRARERLTLALAREAGALTINGEIIASGHRYDNAANTRRLGGYAVVNAGIDYRYSAATTLFARAVNLFDKRYALASDYATPRAGLFVGVRRRFD